MSQQVLKSKLPDYGVISNGAKRNLLGQPKLKKITSLGKAIHDKFGALDVNNGNAVHTQRLVNLNLRFLLGFGETRVDIHEK